MEPAEWSRISALRLVLCYRVRLAEEGEAHSAIPGRTGLWATQGSWECPRQFDLVDVDVTPRAFPSVNDLKASFPARELPNIPASWLKFLVVLACRRPNDFPVDQKVHARLPAVRAAPDEKRQVVSVDGERRA